MLQCTRKNKVELLFPHLVTALWIQAKVQMRLSSRFLQPIKFPILELSVEYLIGHLKHKRAIKTKPYLDENVLFDLEWIVQWMQKVGPIYEDYVRKSRLKLLQFPVVKYEVKAKLSKTKKEKKSKDEEDHEEDLEEDPEEDLEEDPKEVSKGELDKVVKRRSLIPTHFEIFLFFKLDLEF
ncbi:hypothetical protein GOBAR_DD03423 [Gossypium barbadense]|nr:hypothetical protein GOBAR_DD03423 [Gossypium barbadense]